MVATHPIADVEWWDHFLLKANNWNPNHVFGRELKLLKLSLLTNGWTQPVVIHNDGEIVDGFHRWTLVAKDPDIRAMTEGKVPVVIMRDMGREESIVATVRHNRARGTHGLMAMAKLTKELVESGIPKEQVAERMGMEMEEINRLMEMKGVDTIQGKDHFGKGWEVVRR